MSIDEQKLLQHLKEYDRGEPNSSWEDIDRVHDPYEDGPDRLHRYSDSVSQQSSSPAFLAVGRSAVFYYYTKGPKNDERKVKDGSGRWESITKKSSIMDRQGSRVAGYKQRFKFIPGRNGRDTPNSWVMMEYTLPSDKNKKAICAIQEEGSSGQ